MQARAVSFIEFIERIGCDWVDWLADEIENYKHWNENETQKRARKWPNRQRRRTPNSWKWTKWPKSNWIDCKSRLDGAAMERTVRLCAIHIYRELIRIGIGFVVVVVVVADSQNGKRSHFIFGRKEECDGQARATVGHIEAWTATIARASDGTAPRAARTKGVQSEFHK